MKHKEIIEKSAHEVAKPVVYSTLVIVSSFLPVFLLTGQEGKLFHPLAWTKTLVMLASSLTALTLVPVLMSFFMQGKLKKESENPVSRFFNKLYEPLLLFCLKWKKSVLGVNILALLIAVPLFLKTGSEFMPSLDEGSILFMPTTLPSVSNAEIKRILQVQDKIIAQTPEVQNVLGKAGRAYSATDNAPMSMIETIILLKPQKQWRKGMTKAKIIEELDQKLQIPGVTNGWTQPIINRINMLATGIRSDVGIKVYGANLDTISQISQSIKDALQGTAGIEDLFLEQAAQAKYLDLAIKRDKLSQYGLSVQEVNMVIESALGGMQLTTILQGRERYPVALRLAPDFRKDLAQIGRIPIKTANYGYVALGELVDFTYREAPDMIGSENALPRGVVLFNVRNRDLGSTVKESMQKLEDKLTLPQGYFVEWSGQWENQIHAQKTLSVVIPLVLIIIFFILYLTYKDLKESVITLLSVPFALIGGVYAVYFWGMNISVAVAVGFIALFGVAVETGILMVVYLNQALADKVAEKNNNLSVQDIEQAVLNGSVKRLRPKLMTVSVTLLGLFPVLWSKGVGADLMLPIALPMLGGMFTSTVHVLLVTPLIFFITKAHELKKYGQVEII
jgi:copper/silver efflux system protein